MSTKSTTKKTTKKAVTEPDAPETPQDTPEQPGPLVPVDGAPDQETEARAAPETPEAPKLPDPIDFSVGDMLEFNEKDPAKSTPPMKSAPAKTEKAAPAPEMVAPPIPKPTGAPTPIPISKQVENQVMAPPIPNTPAVKAQRAQFNRRPRPPANNAPGGYVEQRVSILERDNAELKKQVRTLNLRITSITGTLSDLVDPPKK